MHLSLLIIVVPLLLLLVLVLVRGAINIFRAFRDQRRPRPVVVIGFIVELLVLDGVLSLAIMLNAALSHSEAAKAAAFAYCILLFLVLVVLPVAVLLLFFWRIGPNDHSDSA